jgi:hypothetical protein
LEWGQHVKNENLGVWLVSHRHHWTRVRDI